MLTNVKLRLHEELIQELLSYSVFPDPDRLEQTIQQYETDDSLLLFGYESESVMVGIIGFRLNKERELVITHLSVGPESRGVGFGRGIILETIEEMKPVTLIAETDEEAVEFYRSIGFIINSLGEQYPETERFRCIYEVEEETLNE
ncbi:GNAT family N-acetyltransferase [Paenibacillus sp. SYP-B3998]|uniref:GNAT family N-acetyltransferase n=2 Tax=Paenibacillus sp. SYP-B3998 TaxID=2678564 RepID=A0A6G3ZY13_9BACL|nr:GNAT family N-acetyltransferase [Paenibacillus sp. SYP-B3998]